MLKLWMSRIDSERLFQLVGKDPNAWLEQSEGLYASACAVRDYLLSIRNTPHALRRIETKGLVHSSLLLLGLAVENATKAVYVARDPTLVSKDKLDMSPFNSDGGHGVKDFVTAVLAVTPVEAALLERLQEHVVWAGRYPIPRKAGRYHDSHHPINKRSMRTSDFEVARSLIDRLRREVKAIRHLPKPPL